MPAFIALNLILGFLAQTQSPYQMLLASSTVFYAGITIIAAGLLLTFTRNIDDAIRYDTLACGVLLSWFSHWHLFFANDLPMFYLFPLFFALMTALVSLVFIGKRDQFDRESLEHLRYFAKRPLLHPALVITAVVVSIFLPSHYLLFPVLMNAFIVRYTLTRCLPEH